MNKLERLTKYDFHDSLLENIFYDKKNSKVLLEVDLCNWKQEWYKETDEETMIIYLSFDDISYIHIPEFELNSDEIIKFDVLKDKGIKITAYNDIKETSYEIIIHSDSVEIIAGKKKVN